jgi:hypothetical protein
MLSGLVRQRAEACQVLHGGSLSDLEISAELIPTEIQDVAGKGPATPLAECVSEAIWDQRLDSAFAGAYGRYPIRFR